MFAECEAQLGTQLTVALTFELLGASMDGDKVARIKLGVHCAGERNAQQSRRLRRRWCHPKG